MGDTTGIQWAGSRRQVGSTWNPWMGCTKVPAAAGAPGSACDFCYAETYAEPKHKYRQTKAGASAITPLWGKSGVRQQVLTSWNEPLEWDQAAANAKRRHRVFTASLADIFDDHPSIKPEWRSHVFDLIERTSNLDWQVLTKRPGNIRRMVPAHWLVNWPANCWIGASVESDHASSIARIQHLLDLAGNPAVRFLSCEPLLSGIDLRSYLGKGKINWVIAGGETGGKAATRKTELDWFRSIRDQCAAAEVAFFYKQPGQVLAKDPVAKAAAATKISIKDAKPLLGGKPKSRDQYLLDGKAHWEWPLPKRGKPPNTKRGLAPPLDHNQRQARQRSMDHHLSRNGKKGWEDLIHTWLDVLPIKEREEAAERIRQAVADALEKP